MYHPKLILTPHELQWNSIYDDGTKRGVLERHYTGFKQLSTAAKQGTYIFQTSRRTRVWGVTFSGDVYGAKVQISTSTGEKYTVGACHIPSISGHGVTSRLSVTPNIGAYPQATTNAIQPAPAWTLEFQPNIVLPGSKQLFFDLSLDNPDDTVPAPGTPYLIAINVHVWEFPGFEGAAL